MAFQNLSFNSSKLSNTNVGYKLFLHREELRRPNARFLKLSKTKLSLTQELVSYSIENNMPYFDVDELKNLNREMRFTRKLKSRMHIIKKIQTQLKEDDGYFVDF